MKGFTGRCRAVSRCSLLAVAAAGLLLPQGSADAARSRATDPAAARAEPAAILGLRRCTARAARRTLYTTFGASAAIASTVSRRGWRRRHGTPMTIHATGETSSSPRKNRDTRPAAGVSVPAVAGACVPGLRIRSICCRKFSCTSAAVGASVPRPHATSPKPAAPAHSARARCRRPAAQCPAPAAAWVTTGATACTHPSVREGLPPVQKAHKGPPVGRRGLAVITSHPGIVAQAARVCQAPGLPPPRTLPPGRRARLTCVFQLGPGRSLSGWPAAGGSSSLR
jgi:hypothetical protein